MFSHVVVGTNDIKKSKIFYDAIFRVTGAQELPSDSDTRLLYAKDHQMFMVSKPINGEPATYANGGTIGLAMASPEMVKAWHQAGVEHGGQSIENPPGEREVMGMKLFLAYLRDPDGNKLCAFYKAS